MAWALGAVRRRGSIPLLIIGLSVLAASSLHRAGAQPAGARSPEPVRLPRPSFTYAYRRGGEKPPATRMRLVKVSERRNQITDFQRWLRTNGLSLPNFNSDLPNGRRGEIPIEVPDTFAGARLVRAIRDGEQTFLIYGPDYSGGRYLVAYGAAGTRPSLALDFANYLQPPRIVAGERQFVEEWVQWAEEAGGLVYVSNFHRTYARSSKGQNGYLTALEPESGKVRWRSRPLVCNSSNFALHRDVVITGYGFTAEPDYLYLLNRHTGAIVQTIKLKSGPEYIVVKGDRVYVRTYDRDYVFRIKG